MPNFSYKAIDETGMSVSGVIQADTIEAATNIIAARGYIPSRVKEQRGGSGWISLSGINEKLATVKSTDLILFTKQFKTMLQALASTSRVCRPSWKTRGSLSRRCSSPCRSKGSRPR